MSNIVRLPGVPITDPAYALARRGRPAANSGLVRNAEALSAEEVGALIGRCNPRTSSGARNRALIATMWRGGLRNGEAVGRWFRPREGKNGPQPRKRRYPGIMPGDVDIERGLIRVTYGKGNRAAPYKPRTVAVDPGGMAFIELWMNWRRELGIPRNVQLFCTIADDAHRHGGQWRPLSGVYVRNLLKRLARSAGIEHDVWPHALRHTMAWDWTVAGVPLPMIQDQLGHADLSTTGRYVAHVAPVNLIEAANKLVWPAAVPTALGGPRQVDEHEMPTHLVLSEDERALLERLLARAA